MKTLSEFYIKSYRAFCIGAAAIVLVGISFGFYHARYQRLNTDLTPNPNSLTQINQRVPALGIESTPEPKALLTASPHLSELANDALPAEQKQEKIDGFLDISTIENLQKSDDPQALMNSVIEKFKNTRSDMVEIDLDDGQKYMLIKQLFTKVSELLFDFEKFSEELSWEDASLELSEKESHMLQVLIKEDVAALFEGISLTPSKTDKNISVDIVQQTSNQAMLHLTIEDQNVGSSMPRTELSIHLEKINNEIWQIQEVYFGRMGLLAAKKSELIHRINSEGKEHFFSYSQLN